MHVLVTGGAGFIGANLCRALELSGHTVTAFDDLSTGFSANLDGTDTELAVGTVLDQAALDGYLIRTRTDSPTDDARNNDTARRDAALASGAHYLSTDYYVADPSFGTGYFVGVPPVCNPVTAPPSCDDALLIE